MCAMRLATAAALAGAADTATFAITRRQTLIAHPGRAAGTLASLGIWSALAQSAAAGARPRARALAGAAVLANGAMLGVHVRAGVPNPRIYAGAGLALAALMGTVVGS